MDTVTETYDSLLEDDELSCTEEENKQEIENKKNEVLENENLDDKKEKLLIADVKRDEQEEEFEEYVLIKEDEKIKNGSRNFVQ